MGNTLFESYHHEIMTAESLAIVIVGRVVELHVRDTGSILRRFRLRGRD